MTHRIQNKAGFKKSKWEKQTIDGFFEHQASFYEDDEEDRYSDLKVALKELKKHFKKEKSPEGGGQVSSLSLTISNYLYLYLPPYLYILSSHPI